MIYGLLQPDSGQFGWQGQPVQITNPQQARAMGIGMVFQHFSLFESLTVAENIELALPQTQARDQLNELIRTGLRLWYSAGPGQSGCRFVCRPATAGRDYALLAAGPVLTDYG